MEGPKSILASSGRRAGPDPEVPRAKHWFLSRIREDREVKSSGEHNPCWGHPEWASPSGTA